MPARHRSLSLALGKQTCTDVAGSGPGRRPVQMWLGVGDRVTREDVWPGVGRGQMAQLHGRKTQATGFEMSNETFPTSEMERGDGESYLPNRTRYTLQACTVAALSNLNYTCNEQYCTTL
ncbi:hypothetical protein NDU88_010643 [Pleurodeles waltl]|uniref:Uncharacterized protein n=1 Tax=Pleurodeles waltl TaxID=8319 RepID=A0AAV7R0W9_PLEWA|nr:hypothetical protein NDU88_010643 [Pleurodeles waltl]